MPKKTHTEEANLVDLSDDQLKELLGYTHEALKNLEEQKKTDPDILQMKENLRLYIDDNYETEIKRHKAKLKAARKLAAARGIKWYAPEDHK